MKSLSSVGLGLSVVFGFLFLALIAELYYLLWWKKRFTPRDIENDQNTPATELFYMLCWKKSSSLSQAALNPQQQDRSRFQIHPNKDLLLKPFGEDGIETEFMRLHNLSGPPRFLFTIVEETKEDLESEDGKKENRRRSLNDLLLAVETPPFLTPLTSPSFFTPPLTPMDTYHNQHKFNPLFESASDAEFNKIRSSPPPKFKFLQEAEEKLTRKLMEDADKGIQKINGSAQDYGVKAYNQNLLIDKKLNHSSNSQVIPLASSPLTVKRNHL